MSEEIKLNFSKISKFKLPENWQSNKRWFYISLILLLAIVILGVAIRSTNIPYLKDVTTGNYTLGPDLDPFLYLRMAHELVDYGHLLNPDNMRYLGIAPYHNFVEYGIVAIYRVLSVFSGTASVEYAAIIFPLIFFGLSIIVFFFFVKEIFKKRGEAQSNGIAIIATLLYALIPAMQHRTTAGIPELESAGLLFFWLSFYFFLKAFNEDRKIFGKIEKKYLFALLAGISTSFMIYTWGGFRFIFLAIPLACLIAFFIGKIRKEGILLYFSWYIPSAITLMLKGGYQSLYQDITTSTLSLIVFLTFLVYLLLKEKLWEKIKGKIKVHLSREAFSFLFVILVGLIVLLIIKPEFILNLLPSLKDSLLHPFGDTRTGLTVAENAQPYVTSWISELSAPIFWMFFAGTIFLFYEATKYFEDGKKIQIKILFGGVGVFIAFFIFITNKISDAADKGLTEQVSLLNGNLKLILILTLIFFLAIFIYSLIKNKHELILNSAFIFFLIGFIFSNYSSDNAFNGISSISQVTYFGALLILIFGFFYIYLKNAKKDSLKEIEFPYLLTISLIILMVLASRGAIRLLVISSPVFIIPVAFLVVDLLSFRIKAKNKLWRWMLFLLFLVAVFFIISTVVNYEKTTATYARYTIPSSYDIQWQKAMAWVRENTAINSIFVHWWDYGYWVQTIGQRPTVTDGGHAIGYWDHLTGRYLLTTPYPETALSLMKTYNVSYLLIDSSDLGKYPAYSIIGSDSSGNDRYSSIQIMLADANQTQTVNSSTVRVYQNVIPIDEDTIINTSNGQQIFLPQGKAYLIAIVLKTNKDGSSVSFEQPQGVFYYNNQQVQFPMRYLYFNNQLKDFGSGFKGAAYILPTLNSGSGNAQIDNLGSALYLSPKVFKSLFAQLYLMNDSFNEYPTVNLAHSQDSELISNLKSQGFKGDFIYYNGFQGPIKIWKADYPLNVLVNKEFLKTNGDYAELDNLTFKI